MTTDGNVQCEEIAATLDAGDQNCATLILNVRRAITSLDPGEILAVVAYDPSARLDLLAWGRMTGHRILNVQEHDRYTTIQIRKRDDNLG